LLKKILLLGLLFTTLQAFSISIDQPSIFLETRSGHTKTFKITLTNPNSYPIKVKIYSSDWEYNNQGGKRFLDAGSTKHSLSQWLELPKETDIELKAFADKILTFKLKTPEDAKGGRNGVIFFQTDTGLSNKGMSYSARIGSIIYQHTKDKTDYKMTINKATYLKNSKKSNLIIDAINNGNSYNYFKGTVSLLDSRENAIGSKQFKIDLLPGNRKTTTIALPLKNSKKVLLTVEDIKGNIESRLVYLNGIKTTSSAKKQQIKSSSKTLIKAQININKLNAIYTNPKLKFFLKSSATKKQTLTAQVKIFTSSKKRVKTMSLGKQEMLPGKTTTFSGNWDAGSYLTKGKYTLKLELLDKKGKLLYSLDIGKITKTSSQLKLSVPAIINRKLTL